MGDPSELHDIVAWLEQDDANSRPYRARRMQEVVDWYGDVEFGRLFPGGPVSAYAYDEARTAFVHGEFIGCVLLCQVCVEHALHGLFKWAGRDDLDHATYERTLKEARRSQILSPAEFSLFDRLRRERNPYAHARSLTAKDSLMTRAVDSATDLPEVLVTDAERALKALMDLTRRAPFALREDRESYDKPT